MDMTDTLFAERWQAFINRDAQADGQFVGAVKTTGIYCRPSCPARKPKPENVEFFYLPAEAEKAGYRPCKRCQPRTITILDPRLALVQAICDHICDHIQTPDQLTNTALASYFNFSADYLQSLFKSVLHITPHQYMEVLRVQHLKQTLRQSSSVTHAIYEAGFSAPSRVYERSAKHIGMTPVQYREGGQGIEIRYGTFACHLGVLLIATTENGICSVCIYDDEPQAHQGMRDEFPEAQITHQPEALQSSFDQIMAMLAGSLITLDLPLDIQATAFQWRVWNELRRIPRGETRTYTQVAEALGNPKAVRAVASACADNRVALVIPCHRVVGTDGAMRGYKWGIDRKRAILEQEAT